jgi:adiponectin receptor
MSGSEVLLRRKTPKAASGKAGRKVSGAVKSLDGETVKTLSIPSIPAIPLKLLSIDQIPEWYAENPFIRTGYRPVFRSSAPCLRSWLYLHNQTANIVTHLVPAVLSLFFNAALRLFFAARYPAAGIADQVVFHVYLTACTLCFGLSAAYHTLLCHSREKADLWVRLDYAGISVLILGSFVPGLYMGFYCEPGLLALYLGMVSIKSELRVVPVAFRSAIDCLTVNLSLFMSEVAKNSCTRLGLSLYEDHE